VGIPTPAGGRSVALKWYLKIDRGSRASGVSGASLEGLSSARLPFNNFQVPAKVARTEPSRHRNPLQRRPPSMARSCPVIDHG